MYGHGAVWYEVISLLGSALLVVSQLAAQFFVYDFLKAPSCRVNCNFASIGQRKGMISTV